MIMFFIFAISKCLFEKNLANKIISTSFIGSDGPKKKDPKLNQRAPPFAICPKTNIKLRKLIKNIYNVITRYEFFKNLISIKEKIKKKKTEIPINNNCLQKIELSESKGAIVTNPKIIKVKKQKKITQSPFLKNFIKSNLRFSKKFMLYFI